MSTLMYNGLPLEKMAADDSNQMVYLPSKGKLISKGDLRKEKAVKTAMEFVDSLKDMKAFDISSLIPEPAKKITVGDIKDLFAMPPKFNIEDCQNIFSLDGLRHLDNSTIQWVGKPFHYSYSKHSPVSEALEENSCPLCEMESKGIPVARSAHVEKHLNLDHIQEYFDCLDSSESYDDYINSFVDKEDDALDGVDTSHLNATEVAKLDADIKYFRQLDVQGIRKPLNGFDDENLIKTGNSNFDKRVGGFPIGQLSVVIGTTCFGRSTFADMIACELAKNNKVSYYSFEGHRDAMLLQHGCDRAAGKVNGWLYAMDSVDNSDCFLQDLEDDMEMYLNDNVFNKVVIIDDFSVLCPFEPEQRRMFVNKLAELAHKYDVAMIVMATAARNGYDGDSIWNTLDYSLSCTASKILQLKKMDGVSITEAKIVKDRYYNNTSNKAYFHLQARRFLDL